MSQGVTESGERTPSTRAGRVPKHAAIRAILEDRILHRLEPQDCLASERDLMEELDVSRMTLRRAIDSLVADGLLYKVHGSGVFATGRTAVKKPMRVSSFSEDMLARGHVPESRTVCASVCAADDILAADLELHPGREVIHLRRMCLADGEPIALENVYFALSIAPTLLQRLYYPLHQCLRSECGIEIVTADQSISAVTLGITEQQLLNVNKTEQAGLMVCSVGKDYRGIPVEKATTIYRADKYAYHVSVSRHTSQVAST